MEENYKRHGKKTHQETQSPVLKVFKDMIQKEKQDPEKANLLKEKKEKKKRRYSGSRMNSDQNKQRCRDSSSSEYVRRSIQHKEGQKSREYDAGKMQNTPFPQNEKESRWCWEPKKNPSADKKCPADNKPSEDKKLSEDTYSCVSCALKKAMSSEYACMACLGVLFLLSILVAFYVVFRSGSVIAKSEREAVRKPSKLNSDVLKRKIDMLQDAKGNEDTSQKGDKRGSWGGMASRYLGGLSELVGNGYGDDNFRESNAVQDTGLKSDSELASILDPEKFNEGASSYRLRNFYKKLVQTDAQIRAMKKEMNDASMATTFNYKFNFMSDRRKRSLKLGKNLVKSHLKKRNGVSSDEKLHLGAVNSTHKTKRLANDTVPIGIVMEKEEILVQYKPKKVPKCSHVPKDSKSHEKQLKHPFYKNTQRLDELLDQYLDRSLPETIEDPFGIEMLLKGDNAKKTTPQVEINEKVNEAATKRLFTPFKPSKELDKELFEFLSNKKPKLLDTSSPYFNFHFSDTTENPSSKTAASNLVQELPHIRKLLQVNEEDESLGYEEVKEVLADENEIEDEIEKRHDRQKRFYDDHVRDVNSPSDPMAAKPVNGIYNPNWKGPMPLYPDELMSMIRTAALENIHIFNKGKIPITNKDAPLEVDNSESGFNDVDYVDNYSDKKFNKLVRMAQAYSDYGVLNEKKDYLTTFKSPIGDIKQSERRVKSINKAKAKKNSIFDRFKKGSNSGSVRIEMDPTMSPKDAHFSVFKAIGKHVRFGTPDRNPDHNDLVPSTPESVSRDFEMFSSSNSETKYGNIPDDNDKQFGLNFGKGNVRSLLSIRDESDHDYKNNLPNGYTATRNYVDKIENSNVTDFVSLKPTEFNIATKNITKMDLSDFFMLMADWFSVLALAGKSLKTQSNSTNISKGTFTTQNTIVATTEINNTFNFTYPSYDSDMIENIGHRSRVLMSIEDKVHDTTSVSSTKEVNDDKSTRSTDDENPKLAISTTPKNNIVITEQSFNLAVTVLNKSIAADNKTIVKRNALGNSNFDDSKLVFWNGIYDDEYGIMDPLDNAVDDKQTAKGGDFVKKYGNWIQNKIRSVANNIRRKDKSIKEVTKKMASRGQIYLRSDANPRYQNKRFYKRNAQHDKENSYLNHNAKDSEEENKENSNFDSLTAKMKLICKEAAKAVEETRHIHVRQNDKEDTMTTSLMQQLVRLMRDLVDFQVQQKTCLHLPSDLQQFLVWLKTGTTDYKPHKEEIREDDNEISNAEMLSNKEGIASNSRFDYITPLHAVEELLQQYDDMNDQEKAKLTGVKDYLENQSQFLHKQLSNIDEYKVPNLYEIKDLTSRFRRDLSDTPKFRTVRINNPRKRFKRVFLRNFGRKHTKTTASVVDGISTTEINRTNKINHSAIQGHSIDAKERDNNIHARRSVKEEENSDKHTTSKNERDADGFDKAQIVKIEKR